MTEPTLSVRLRAVQDQLNAINNELTVLRDDAIHIGLAPCRIRHIDDAAHDNQQAWQELNELATSLELTGQATKP